MSPSATVSSPPCVPRTVAMRKEAIELRKTLKPLLEKRRRARINESLNRLKTLIMPLVGKDNCHYSKLEKADILEMTVRFLSDIPSTSAKDPTVSYKEGYKACLQRVSALLPQNRLDAETQQRVNEFIQQSLLSSTRSPTCHNCCGQSSTTLPHIQQRLLSLKSSMNKAENPTNVIGAIAARFQPAPQCVSAPLWRPW